MIPYTTDQLFNMLAEVTSHTDVIEVNYYLLQHRQYYTQFDLELLFECINMLHAIFLETL